MEVYVFICIVFKSLVLFYYKDMSTFTALIFKFIVIFQIIKVFNSLIYYNFLRSAFNKQYKVHNFFRKTLLILLSYIEIIILYSVLILNYGNDFSCKINDSISVIYYSVITITTVGYGKIYPVKEHTQIIIVSEILLGMIILVIALSRMLSFTTKPGSHTEELD